MRKKRNRCRPRTRLFVYPNQLYTALKTNQKSQHLISRPTNPPTVTIYGARLNVVHSTSSVPGNPASPSHPERTKKKKRCENSPGTPTSSPPLLPAPAAGTQRVPPRRQLSMWTVCSEHQLHSNLKGLMIRQCQSSSQE
jgi:hypothetical protein